MMRFTASHRLLSRIPPPGLAASMAMLYLAASLQGKPAELASAAATSQATVRVIRFDSLKPEGTKLTVCWDAIGMDHLQRVYIAFSDQNDRTPDDTVLFRYDTRSDKREYLGTLRGISRAEGNLLEGETIAKSHVAFQEYNGKLYFASHDYHAYRKGSEDIYKHRGGHFYAFDLATETFEDLSKTDPGGISVRYQGIIGMTVFRKANKLAGFTFPFGDILVYDLVARKTSFHAGVPEHRNSATPARHIFATDGGKLYFSYYDVRSAPLYEFNLHTGKIRKTDNRYHFGMVYGAIPTRDGSKVYLVDLFGNLYAFHVAKEKLEDLGSLLPPEQIQQGCAVEVCYSLVLSRDERRLYTFPSRFSDRPALRLYEHDLETGKKRQIADFAGMLNGSLATGGAEDKEGRVSGSGVVDEQGRMYFGYHEGGDDGKNAVMLQVSLTETGESNASVHK